MKTACLLTALLAVCMAGTLHTIIHNEVMEILQAEPDLSVDECTSRCDAIFNMVSDHDETATDHQCHHQCNVALTHHHQSDSTTPAA